jgi:hypothetical protein
LPLPSKLKVLSVRGLIISQDVLEKAIKSVPYLTVLSLDINCKELTIRDLYYLKQVSINLGNVIHLTTISNTPNLKHLKAYNLLTLEHSNKKLEYFHYDLGTTVGHLELPIEYKTKE